MMKTGLHTFTRHCLCILIMGHALLCAAMDTSNPDRAYYPESTILAIEIDNFSASWKRYKSSSLYSWLNTRDVLSFFSPTYTNIKRATEFWMNHLSLDEEGVRQIVKDRMLIALIATKSPGTTQRAPGAVPILCFRHNKPYTEKWIRAVRRNIPENADISTNTAGEVAFTTLHYYLKVPVSETNITGAASNNSDTSLNLPGVYREREVTLSYGDYGEHFFIAGGSAKVVRHIFSDRVNRDFIFADSDGEKRHNAGNGCTLYCNLQQFYIKNTIENDNFKTFLALTGIEHARIACNLTKEDIVVSTALTSTMYPPPPGDIVTRKDTHQWSSPNNFKYLILTSFDWRGVGKWLESREPYITGNYGKKVNAVLNNIARSTNTSLTTLITSGIGEYAALFPAEGIGRCREYPGTPPVVVLTLRNQDIVVGSLQPILTFIAKIFSFDYREQKDGETSVFILEEHKKPYIQPRKIVVMVSPDIALISASREVITHTLNQYDEFLEHIKKGTVEPLSEKMLLYCYQQTFDLAGLLTRIRSTLLNFEIPISDFNATVVNLEQHIPSRSFTRHFGALRGTIWRVPGGINSLLLIEMNKTIGVRP